MDIKKGKEVWQTHPRFTFIQASNLGRVRTIDRWVTRKDGQRRFYHGVILKQRPYTGGYLYVSFQADGKSFCKRAHRIVAECFIPNPDNLPQVNHINCDRTDNRVDNLEWCDASYNRQYQEKYGVSSAEARGHSLWAVNIKTLEVLRFSSQTEAANKLGLNFRNINGVIKGRRNQVGNYWFTEDDDIDSIKDNKNKLRMVIDKKIWKHPVIAINIKTLAVLYFLSRKEAGDKLGISMHTGSISRVIKGYLNQTHGYWFTDPDDSAVENTRVKFGDEVANKVAKLMKKTE